MTNPLTTMLGVAAAPLIGAAAGALAVHLAREQTRRRLWHQVRADLAIARTSWTHDGEPWT